MCQRRGKRSRLQSPDRTRHGPAAALMLHGRMCRMSSQERCSSTGTQTGWVSSPKPCPRQLHWSCWTLLPFMIIYWASSASLGLDKRQRERIPSQEWKQSGSMWEPWNPPKLKGFSLQAVNSPHIRSNKLTQKKFQKSMKFWSLTVCTEPEVRGQRPKSKYTLPAVLQFPFLPKYIKIRSIPLISWYDLFHGFYGHIKILPLTVELDAFLT